MQRPQRETVTLNDILITEELSQRSPRSPNLQAENQALRTLARQMANNSETMLQSLVEMAVELCQAGTAGVSLLETTTDGEEVFRWNVLAGTLAQYVGGTTPRNFSPCGTCLDRGSPQLYSHPERYFTYFQATNTPFVEGLVLPLIAENHALGTIWILSHDEQRHFDPEDVRLMTSLADFTATALLLNQRQTGELLAANVRLEAEAVGRKVAEDSLRESEERCRTVLEAAELAAWDWHILTNRVDWNEQHYRLLGLEPVQREESADSFMQFVHPEDLPQVRDRLERAVAENGVYQADFRIIRADTGEIRWMSGYGRAIETQDGQATRMSGVMADSTNRKQAEAELGETKKRLELSLRGANLGVWTYNVSTDEFWADDRAKLMHGHAPHEVHTFAEAGANIHPKDRDRARAAIAQAILDRSKLQIEYRVIWRDGSIRWIASYAEFIPTGDRDEGMFYGVAQDISDRKKAEAAKSESEARLRALIEHLPGGAAFVVDRDLRYLLAQGEALSAAGFKSEDLVGRTIFEVLPPELAAYYEVFYRRGLAGESFEHEHSAHDRSFISRGTPLRSSDGEVYAVLAVSYDISDRKQAEIALRESEEKYRTLFDSIDEAFCLLEILYDEQGAAVDLRYHDTNRVFARQTGIANAEGKRARELIPNLEPFWIETYDRVARTGEPVRFENYVQGTDHWFNVFASRVGGAGSRFVAVVFDDISDRKQAEQELTKTNQLLQATFDNSLQVIQLFKAVRDERGDIADFEWLLTNKQWNDQWGEMAGKRLLTENPAVVETGLFEMFKQVTESGVPITHEHHYAYEQFDGWFWQTIAQVEDGFLLSTIDTTERKRAEAALRESEEKYRLLFEMMDEGYLLSEVIFDENGEPIDILYLEANPAAVRLAGRDFSGQRMREIDPNYEEYWYEIYGRVALTGESMRAERYAEPHDRWFDFYAFKVGGQESRRVAVVFNDITAAKHREAERKRTEEQQTFLLKFSDMLRAEPDADSIANQAVRMLAEHLRLDRFWLSEVFEQPGISTVGPEYHRPDLPPMSGVFRLSDYPETMRQLATQPMVIHDVVNDPGFSDSEKAMLSQLHLRALLVASLREGQHQVIWALAAAMTTPRHWNESERVLLEKVSEFVWAAIGRARVEAALRESEAKYRTLFESIDQGYCLIELILNQEGKPIDWLYLEANQSYQRQVGLGDMVGRRLLEFVPNLEPEWFDFYGNVARTGEPARLEYPVEAIGRWFTVYASRVGGEGSLLVAIVFEDITDRKRTETNLAFLAEISQDLVHLTNIDETMDAIGAKIGRHFNVARAVFAEISEDQETGRVSHEWHQPNLPDMKGTYATKAYFSPEFERLHRAGEIAVVHDTATDQRVDGARYAALGVGAFVGVPLIRQDKWRFYFSLLDCEPRNWRDDEIELLRELTTRIWTRLERARAEAALRESEARRHLALEAAEMGTFLYHPQQDRGEPDARMLALFGLGEGDTLNLAEAIAKMIHPDDRELYAAAVATAVNPNGDGKLYAEIRVIHPDESLHWVAVTAQTVFEGEPPQPVRMYGIAADITDRKRAEAALRDSEARLAIELADTQQLQRISSQLIREDDINVLYEQILDAAIAVMRSEMGSMQMLYPERNELQLLAWTGFTPESAAFWESVSVDSETTCGEALNTGDRAIVPDVETCDFMAGTADLDFYRLSGVRAVQSTPLVSRSGNIVGMISTHWRDVHQPSERELRLLDVLARQAADLIERRRAEEALRESEEKYRSLFNSIDEGYALCELLYNDSETPIDWRILEVNPAFESLTGLTDAASKSGSELGQALNANWLQRFSRVAQTGEAIQFEQYIGGLDYWFHICVSRIDGDSRRIVVVFSNITERKRSEEALRASERKLQSAIAVAQLSPYEWNPLTGELKWDARLKAMWGLSADAEINYEIHNAGIHPEDREYLERQVAKAVDPNGDGIFEAEFRTVGIEDNIERWVSARGQTFFDDLGRPVRYVGAAQDVTDRKQAEADRIQLIQEQANRLEAERVNQMKDEFLAMVSHELQSPLVAILGWTRLLRANPPATAMLTRSLETIERSATLQAKLISDLLDISRITAGKLRLVLQTVELKSTIEAAIAAVETAAIAKNISLQHPITNRPIASMLVMGDRDRLQQIFCNLLTNAIKFTPDSGSVTVELSVRKAENFSSSSVAEIRVIDTGIGISAEFLPHVFDRFRQAEKSGSAKGLGLGLAIARHLVELHNGTIYAQSAGVGQGTTFIVRLRLLDKDETV